MSIPQISLSIGSNRIRTTDFKKFRSELKKTQNLALGDSNRDIRFRGNSSHTNFSEQKHDQLPPE